MKRFIDSAKESGQAAVSATRHEQAWLRLGFAADAGTTRMMMRSHCGPLRVQKDGWRIAGMAAAGNHLLQRRRCTHGASGRAGGGCTLYRR